jgi:hypothetical protein
MIVVAQGEVRLMMDQSIQHQNPQEELVRFEGCQPGFQEARTVFFWPLFQKYWVLDFYHIMFHDQHPSSVHYHVLRLFHLNVKLVSRLFCSNFILTRALWRTLQPCAQNRTDCVEAIRVQCDTYPGAQWPMLLKRVVRLYARILTKDTDRT